MGGVNPDFLGSLPPDVVDRILTSMDDPGDVVRASSVSHAWRHFVISNGISKRLCLRLFPQLSAIDRVVDMCEDTSNTQQTYSEVGSSGSAELERLKKEHRVFIALAITLTYSEVNGELFPEAVSASSTDNYPDEGPYNTLDPRDQTGHRLSYWSSSGQRNPEVPERLTYTLASDFCVITEIAVQPYQAVFQPKSPIYSAKAVRIRTGCKVLPIDDEEMGEVDSLNGHVGPASDEEQFIWTYTSKEFPMTQENCLQNFKLPEPVLCIGGILQIELLGRVQRQEMNGLFYICVAYVEVFGSSLASVFRISPVEPPGMFALMFNPQAEFSGPSSIQMYSCETSIASTKRIQQVRGWDLNTLPVDDFGDEYLASDEEMIDDFAP